MRLLKSLSGYFILFRYYFRFFILFSATSSLSFISYVQGQDLFTRIESGDIVNDGGISVGAAWGDYNNDGFADLYVTNFNRQNNFLYMNNRDGTFRKITSGDIVNDGGISSGPCWGDYDNDGDLDLFVSNQQNENNFLYKNNGDGTFIKVLEGIVVNETGHSYTSAWGDYNNDGFLDLFVANAGQKSFLYKNNGDGTFTSLGSGGGLLNETGSFWNASWADFNDDGYLDIFIADGDGTDNILFRNSGNGSFIKVNYGPVVNNGGYSKAGSWGDYDNDGDLDLFVANAGTNLDGTKDFLYKNNGNGSFTRITEGPVVNTTRYSHGGTWGDFDNDGDLDLFVGVWIDPDLLYLNNGDGTFTRVNEGAIVIQESSTSCTPAVVDYDNDGDLDIFNANWSDENNILFRNNSSGRNWIRVKCKGLISNKSGIGSRVYIRAEINGNTVTQMREINTNTGCRSQSSSDACFGLGHAQIADSLWIKWPSGRISNMNNIDVNRILTIIEPEESENYGDNTVPEDFHLFQNYPNPFNPKTTIKYFLKNNSKIELNIFSVTGREIKTLENQIRNSGDHSIVWDGRDNEGNRVNSGLYIYRLNIDGRIKCKKMLLIK